MSHEEVMELMRQIGLPFAYDHFAEGESPEPPFLVFLYPGANNFAADGVVYFHTNRLHIELYTDLKSPELERGIEAVLTEKELFYQKSEAWIASERLYEVLYELEV